MIGQQWLLVALGTPIPMFNLILDTDGMHLCCSSLQGNEITGEIPKEFGNLTSLTMLNLENNHLSGEIPSSLGNLKKLKFLCVVLSAFALTFLYVVSLLNYRSFTVCDFYLVT